jgi:hypothetical protein
MGNLPPCHFTTSSVLLALMIEVWYGLRIGLDRVVKKEIIVHSGT